MGTNSWGDDYGIRGLFRSPSTTWNGSLTRAATLCNLCCWTNSPRTRTGISCSPNPYASGLFKVHLVQVHKIG